MIDEKKYYDLFNKGTEYLRECARLKRENKELTNAIISLLYAHGKSLRAIEPHDIESFEVVKGENSAGERVYFLHRKSGL